MVLSFQQGDETNGVEFLEDEFGLSTRLAIALLGEYMQPFTVCAA